MVDLVFAIGQFLCVIGLLYGLILTLVNWKYAGPIECRTDPVIGDDWFQDPLDANLQLIIVPEQTVTMIKLDAVNATETPPLSPSPGP